MAPINEENATAENARAILHQMNEVLHLIEGGDVQQWNTLAGLDDQLLDIIAFQVNVLAAKREVLQLLDNLKVASDYAVLKNLIKSIRKVAPRDEESRVLELRVDAAVFSRRYTLVKAVKTALSSSGYDHEGLRRTLSELEREFPETFQIPIFRQAIAERRVKFLQDMQQHFEEQLTISPDAAQLVLESIEAVVPRPDELDIVTMRKRLLQAAQEHAAESTQPARV